MSARVHDVAVELFERERPAAASTAAVRFATARPPVREALVSIRSDDGVVGECLVGGVAAHVALLGDQIQGFLREQLIGRDVSERERLWSQVPAFVHYGSASRQAWAAVDVALWDLAGKQAGQPVCRLLGTAREQLPLVLSSAFHATPEQYVEEALAYRARGVRAYKPHPGGRPAHEVIALAGRLREAVGPDWTLMLDASLLYSFEDALAIGRALERHDFAWFEDPLPWAQEAALRELGWRLEIPLAATDWVAADVSDVIGRVVRDPGLRIVRAGSRELGITGLKRMASLAEAFGRRCELHVHDGTHMNLANLHVGLSAPACGWLELVEPAAWVQWGTTAEIAADADGLVHAPGDPGLGATLDRELLAHHRVTTIRA